MRDIDVRIAIKSKLARIHAEDENTRIVEEMGIWSGSVRVDVAVINGELCGFEIKSDSDTLKRLPNQLEIYGKVFDRVTLVVGERLYQKAMKLIPSWWGCEVASMIGNQAKLELDRKPRKNPRHDPQVLVQLLLKSETIDILAQLGLDRGWRSKRASELSAKLLHELPLKLLRYHVREALKRRVKLGQSAPCDLDMPVEIEPNPHTRIARCRRGVVGNVVNPAVSPTVRKGMSRPQSDYLLGVSPELLVLGHTAWTFGLDAAENHETVGHSIFGIDRGGSVDFDRRPRRNTSVVAKIEPVGQSIVCNSAPKSQLVSGKGSRAKTVPRKRRRNGGANKRDGAPLDAIV